MTYSIAEIKAKLQNDEVDERFLERLKTDQRKGVQALIRAYERKKERLIALEAMHERMSRSERALRRLGYTLIAGVDEVGRGPLAGPVVASAVILPESFKLLGMTDSKKLSKKQREQFAEIIQKEAIAYSLAFVSAAEIDRLNIYEATKKAMVLAVERLQTRPDILLVDAIDIPVTIEQRSLIKGDEKSISIAASSILAKVARDRYMEKIDATYPGYGFKDNVGYGTRAHLEAIDRLGLTPEHRHSFRPVREAARRWKEGDRIDQSTI